MNCEVVRTVYFSPAGTTKTVVEAVAAELPYPKQTCNLLRKPQRTPQQLGAADCLVVGVPVYAGRVPAVCAEMLKNFRGDGTPAIAVAVYGNRDYDDALLELRDLLEAVGFVVIGAAAFVAQHSIFPEVGKGRPDGEDLQKISAFGAGCAQLLASLEVPQSRELPIKGAFPYRKPSPIILKPSANSECNGCGACARVCPAGAIPANKPKITIMYRCLSCAACIHICPRHARDFRGPIYSAASASFSKKCGARREPETFL